MIAALIVVPIVAGLALYALPRSADAAAKWIGVAIASAVTLGLAAFRDLPDETAVWLQQPFTATFHVGLGDGPATWIALMLGLTTACALAVTRVPRTRDFVAQMLILLGSMLGVFLARDLLLFALFWDLQLVPTFLILVGWSPGRSSATAWRYLIYNLAGGLVLLLATAAFGAFEGTTDVANVAGGYVPARDISPALLWIFLGTAFAFAIKTPIWPFHTWMPATYADLPAPAAAVVSAVQSKGGLYGFITFGLLLFRAQMHAVAPVMIALGLVGLLYGALAALVADDAKRIVAYSSLSHLGLMVLGVFSFNPIALGGTVVYIVAHGLFSAGLFVVLGQVEQREETRSLARLGGLGARNPRLAGALTIVVLAALGLPGLCGFAGEILILTGVYQAGLVWQAALALVPVVLAAAYMLRLFQGMMQGPAVPDVPEREDMTPLEGFALAPLVLAILVLGVAPGPVAQSVAAMRAPAAALAPGEPAR